MSIEAATATQNAIAAINPANQNKLGEVAYTDIARFPEMMSKARAAQKIWASKSFKQRAQHVSRVQQYLVDNMDELADVISKDNGKTKVDALATEVMACVMACKWYRKNTQRILKRKWRGSGELLLANKFSTIEHVPLGVVGIISPWNYPFSIPFGEIIMGLMAGNAIILKAASATPMISKKIDEALAAGGFPDGLYQQIYVSGSAASKVMLENEVDKLFFTGSTAVGMQLMAEAASTLTPLSLELGGNDPAIVLADANLERTANGLIWAAFQNAGQSCGGVERVYCHASIYDDLVNLLADKVKRLRHGDPEACGYDVDVGAFTTAKQLNTVKTHLQDALERGAKIVAQSQAVGGTDKGYFHPVTLLVDVPEDALLMQEETFGLLMPVVSFTDVEEALEKANDDAMALTSSVWTGNSKKGRELASRMETGVTMVNDHLMSHGMHETPWGGWKGSGIGRTHGPEGLLEMTQVKAVIWDVLAPKRNLWWHPFDQSTYDILKATALIIHKPISVTALKSLLVLSTKGLKKMFTRF